MPAILFETYWFKLSLGLDNLVSASDSYRNEFGELKILCFEEMATLTHTGIKHEPFSKDLAALE